MRPESDLKIDDGSECFHLAGLVDDEPLVLEVGNDECLATGGDEQVIAGVDRELIHGSTDDLAGSPNEIGRYGHRSDTDHRTLGTTRHLSNGDD